MCGLQTLNSVIPQIPRYKFLDQICGSPEADYLSALRDAFCMCVISSSFNVSIFPHLLPIKCCLFGTQRDVHICSRMWMVLTGPTSLLISGSGLDD